MIVTLAQMKTYLGETTTDYDDFLTQQLAVVNNSIENYCGRKFDPLTYIQTFYRDSIEQNIVPSISLFHYPVTAITTIQNEDAETYTNYRLKGNSGKLTATNDSGYKSCWFQNYNQLEVTYDAGYTTMPPELQQVVYSIVAESYNKKKAGIDVGFGNNVQRISVAGVMSLDFDYTLNSNERKNGFGMILGDWLNVLDYYRSERPVLGEIWEAYVA